MCAEHVRVCAQRNLFCRSQREECKCVSEFLENETETSFELKAATCRHRHTRTLRKRRRWSYERGRLDSDVAQFRSFLRRRKTPFRETTEELRRCTASFGCRELPIKEKRRGNGGVRERNRNCENPNAMDGLGLEDED